MGDDKDDRLVRAILELTTAKQMIPTIRELAAETGESPSMVSIRIRRLEKVGRVARTARASRSVRVVEQQVNK